MCYHDGSDGRCPVRWRGEHSELYSKHKIVTTDCGRSRHSWETVVLIYHRNIRVIAGNSSSAELQPRWYIETHILAGDNVRPQVTIRDGVEVELMSSVHT